MESIINFINIFEEIEGVAARNSSQSSDNEREPNFPIGPFS